MQRILVMLVVGMTVYVLGAGVIAGAYCWARAWNKSLFPEEIVLVVFPAFWIGNKVPPIGFIQVSTFSWFVDPDACR